MFAVKMRDIQPNDSRGRTDKLQPICIILILLALQKIPNKFTSIILNIELINPQMSRLINKS